MWNAELDETQAGIDIARRNINDLRYSDNITLMAEIEEELKSLLMKVKEESEEACLKQHSKNEDHGSQSHHFMANKWGNNGNSERLYFGGLQKSPWMVTAAMKLKEACCSEEKLWLGPSSQSYGFPVVMYGCEIWTIKKAEHWRIDGFELWCWRRLLKVSWTARRFNQSILKEISPEYSLEGLMLKL